jgi:hypothetical protein
MEPNEPAAGPTVDASGCSCKVGRLVETYDLDGLHEDLVVRWRGEGRDQHSLRDLETHVNQQVLRAALEASGIDPLDGEVANFHRLLADDNASEGARTETRARLAHDGVDVDQVESDFVSHQTIHTHLRDCLDVSHDPAEQAPSERRTQVSDTISALQRRTETVTEGSLERLRDANALALAGFDVLVDVTVTCRTCGRVHDARDLLEEGGCDCQQPAGAGD